MKKFFIFLVLFSNIEFSFSQNFPANQKDSTIVEISMIYNAADDMEKGRYTKTGSAFFNHYFNIYGLKATFKEDSVYNIINRNLKPQKQYPSIKYIAWARIVLKKNGKRDVIYLGLQPHDDLFYNGRFVKIKHPEILTSFLYKILMEKYDRKDFQIVGSEVDEFCFKITTGMLFSQ